MKKFIGIIILVVLATTGYSQSILQPVSKNLFRIEQKKLQEANPKEVVPMPTSMWLFRLNTGVMGTSYGKNKETNQMEITPLSAVGFGIGYLHYRNADNVPFNDFGINALLLQNTQSAGMGVGLFGTYNTGPIGLLNLGGHYDFNLKQFFVDTGLTFHF